jgi:hypothetical protein
MCRQGLSWGSDIQAATPWDCAHSPDDHLVSPVNRETGPALKVAVRNFPGAQLGTLIGWVPWHGERGLGKAWINSWLARVAETGIRICGRVLCKFVQIKSCSLKKIKSPECCLSVLDWTISTCDNWHSQQDLVKGIMTMAFWLFISLALERVIRTQILVGELIEAWRHLSKGTRKQKP